MNPTSEQPEGWQKVWSKTHKRDYWFNTSTGEKSWSEPTTIAKTSITTNPENHDEYQSRKRPLVMDNSEYQNASTSSSSSKARALCKQNIYDAIEAERLKHAVNDPDFPRYISTVDVYKLAKRLRQEYATKLYDDPNFKVIFSLPDEETANLTRAIQEDQILKVKLKLYRGDSVIDLKSFWEVWNQPDGRLKAKILSKSDPNEAKWTLAKEFQYKIATTFMPAYAKAIYEYFGAKIVLDPCAGWGDRLSGAAAADTVKKYVAFDPNVRLRAGYTKIMDSFGHEVMEFEKDKISFDNGFEIHTLPFEQGASTLADNSFDFVFTSPPFFDYEMYSPENPDYRDWTEEFYVPLMKHSCRCVKSKMFVGIYIGDTSAGKIESFMRDRVQEITSLRFVYFIAFRGIYSKGTRGIWIFQKQ